MNNNLFPDVFSHLGVVLGELLQLRVVFLQTFSTNNLDVDSEYIYDLKMNTSLFSGVFSHLGVVLGELLKIRVVLC